jgi:DNA repair protein RadD
MIPRSYQAEAVDALFQYFASNKGNPLIALPTGSGKSLVMAMFIERALKAYPETRILKLTHVKELIAQNAATLKRLWPEAPVGIYSAGLSERTFAQVTFGGVASVYRKAEHLGHIDIVIIDEAHLLSPSENTMYQKLIAALSAKNPFLKVIGLTATPFRVGQGMLTNDGLFTDIAYDMTGIEAFNRLVADGYLAPLVAKPTHLQVDTSQLHTRQGEFMAEEVDALMNRAEITERAIEEAIRLGSDRKCWIAYCASVAHAESVSEALTTRGISSTCIHSKMPDDERDARLADYKAGKYRAVTNFGVLTTGFDHPPIDLMLLLRPVKSPGLHVQILGRGTRPFASKANCLVLDFAGNVRRLGPINNPVLPRAAGASQGGGEAPMKTCPSCETLVPIIARECEYCGHEFPRNEELRSRAGTADLVAKSALETVAVDKVQYHMHRKEGKPVSLRVTYICKGGIEQYQQWVCFEHEGYARLKAEQWWVRHGGESPPLTVADALTRVSTLHKPTHITVNKSTKYPEVTQLHFHTEEE